MDSEPLISVCIPAFNGEEFIVQTVESVLNQSLTDFELIISDDRSTDQTLVLVKGLADRRIRLVQNESNVGMGENWNRSLSHARGKYVKLLGQDDLLHPECLSRQAAVLDSPANSGVVLTVCNRNVINASGRTVLRRPFPFGPGIVSGSKLLRACTRGGLNLIGEPVVGLFRREALTKTTLRHFSNPYLLDLGLWADLLQHGRAFMDHSYLVDFRISSSAASARLGFRQAAHFRQFVKALRKNSLYQPTLIDSCLASLLSFQWCVLRNLFLKLSLC